MKTTNATKWTRREFSAKTALAMLSGVAVTITGCSDESPTTPTPAPAPPPAAADVPATIGANHGHAGAVTGAELTEGNMVTIDISGNANHPHSVELTAAEVGQIASGARVQKTSSTNAGHAHTVTFN